MIYYNNTFDYSKRIQSEDRIYRIGQTKNCYIIDILSDAGIDYKIKNNLSAKKSLSAEIRKSITEFQQGKKDKQKFKEDILSGL
jgi:SNF2 family DNA or RNA helicase